MCTWLPQHFNLYLLDSIAMHLTLSMCLDDMYLHSIITEHVLTEDTQNKILSSIFYGKNNQVRDIIHIFDTRAQTTTRHVHKQAYINELFTLINLIEK